MKDRDGNCKEGFILLCFRRTHSTQLIRVIIINQIQNSHFGLKRHHFGKYKLRYSLNGDPYLDYRWMNIRFIIEGSLGISLLLFF